MTTRSGGVSESVASLKAIEALNPIPLDDVCMATFRSVEARNPALGDAELLMELEFVEFMEAIVEGSQVEAFW